MINNYNPILYEGPSTLFRDNNNQSLGRGLFCNRPIIKNETIIFFKGDKITFEEAKRRQDLGFGGYTIYITNEVYLDCYPYAFLSDPQDRCWASLANSPLHAHTITYDNNNNEIRNTIRSNCNLCVNRSNQEVRLRAKRNVNNSNFELTYNYSANYFFPPNNF
jgi:hypothetical protein